MKHSLTIAAKNIYTITRIHLSKTITPSEALAAPYGGSSNIISHNDKSESK